MSEKDTCSKSKASNSHCIADQKKSHQQELQWLRFNVKNLSSALVSMFESSTYTESTKWWINTDTEEACIWLKSYCDMGCSHPILECLGWVPDPLMTPASFQHTTSEAVDDGSMGSSLPSTQETRIVSQLLASSWLDSCPSFCTHLVSELANRSSLSVFPSLSLLPK